MMPGMAMAVLIRLSSLYKLMVSEGLVYQTIMLLWPTYKTITAMVLVSEVSKSRPSQVWFSKRRTR